MMRKGLEISNEKVSFTLFINNLSERLHWQGLWFAFGRHGEVTDAFIPRKRNRRGTRFGFVRFTNRRDADRAIERLNGFNLFGSIIHVGYALFNDHTSHWRNDRPSSSRPIAKGSFAVRSETKEPFSEPVKDEFLFTGKTREANLQKSRLSRIQGHVEEETLAKLKKRVIGLMSTDCSTEEVMRRLHAWGLGHLDIKRLGSRHFLIYIEDEELLSLLEKYEWSLLKEERTVWVEVTGTPFHCWNHTTFKRIAETWGTLVALGGNLNQVSGCEKMSILITTNQQSRVEELIEVEVGCEIFVISVSELTMSLTGLNVKPVCPKEKQSSKLVEEKNVQIEESSSSESSSKGGRSFSDAGKGDSKSCDLLGKCEGCINEKRKNILNDQRKPSTCEAFEIEDVSKSGTTKSPNLGGCELLEEEDKEADIACAAATKEAQDLRCTVDYPNTNYVDPGGKMSIAGDRRCFYVSKNNKVDLSDEDEVHGLGGCGSNRNLLVNASPIDLNRVKGLGGCNVESERLLSVDGNNEREVITNRALGDILNMGLSSELNEDLCEMGPCSKEGLSWARKVDSANGKTEAYDFEREVDLEQESMFPELLDYKFRRKYASIAEIHDKALSVKEKRKRDRALKKCRKMGERNVPSELVDPIDSDIARMQNLKKEAKATIELGKKLGVEFVGDEEEVVVELVRIEMETLIVEENNLCYQRVFEVFELDNTTRWKYEVHMVDAAKKVFVDIGGGFYTVLRAQIVFSISASGLE
ncbi:hypothetical protein GQ457_11G030350 [Hibiscus cannabinus]